MKRGSVPEIDFVATLPQPPSARLQVALEGWFPAVRAARDIVERGGKMERPQVSVEAQHFLTVVKDDDGRGIGDTQFARPGLLRSAHVIERQAVDRKALEH